MDDGGHVGGAWGKRWDVVDMLVGFEEEGGTWLACWWGLGGRWGMVDMLVRFGEESGTWLTCWWSLGMKVGRS